ncbi:NAD(P)/FAD-dependent oxidoreductase [Mesorhizobium helmanticense]|uniref:FAD-dependent oxidoreductase n=1 Tax=Mesorhizobium helmanticense TaxID=1776423 RepID=A0A2T4IM22_9HYPH|nr:lycopene cyclase family protein [Mesorhizobium helmanticense]PTE06655.1 hypothetical protein C9427_30475 [Mesorhizobium helmanticense]
MTGSALIVGGGTAGSAAAITLARQGVSVSLFESAPRSHKLSETLYPDAEASIEALGLNPPERKPLSVSYVGQDGETKLYLSLYGNIGVIDRNELDRNLREAAVDAGADLVVARVDKVERSEAGVTLHAQGQCYRGAYLIDASGKNPVTAVPNVTESSRTRLDDRYNAFSHFERASGFGIGCSTIAALEEGFAYVLPIRADRICVGVVTYRDFGTDNVERTYLDLLDGSSFLSALVVNAHRTLPVIAAKNVETTNLPVPDDRILRVGDALGFTDPFLWDGLSFALGTGRLAGQLCADAILAGASDFRAFADRVKLIGAAARRRTGPCCEDFAGQFNATMAVDPHVSPILTACLFAITGGPSSTGFAGLRERLGFLGHPR